MNTPSGACGVKIASKDRKALLSKYGSKLRAISGGARAPAKPPAPEVPKAKAEASDMESCWNELAAAMKFNDKPGCKVKRSDVEDKWFALLKSSHGEKDANDYTPEDWGVVLAAIKALDDIPY